MQSTAGDAGPSWDTDHGTEAGPGTGAGTGAEPGPESAAPKRTRVLLSCAPCRSSKLKCDRQTPCGQCLRRGRVEGCRYAPRREKVRQPKTMAARLRRLEGMVRGIMDSEATDPSLSGASVSAAALLPSSSEHSTAPAMSAASAASQGHGQVVLGKDSATYVGATHVLAILDDIEDLKAYFAEEEDEDGSDHSPEGDAQASDTLPLTTGFYWPRNRADLLRVLPPKHVVDRLIHRYFNANSPSQHILHRPCFLKQYGEFCRDSDSVTLEWIALLLLVIGLATYFSTFTAPHELASDSDEPPMTRFRRYRDAATWAMMQTHGTPKNCTLPPLLLFIEGEFLINRNSQLQCYVLTAVCLRIMLKMGLHRDPAKLPNLSPYAGEMRRRMWNLAVQIDLMVAFHMGLPSMVHGIESDTGLPRNLLDDDLHEDMTELPPARPVSFYTNLTYPIWKSIIVRVFGLVARQTHALTPPSYADVMKLDQLLEERWSTVPPFMKIRPIEESVTDSPALINQRFGLASLYQKSRCVLHRRYMAEVVPDKEHAYSRRVCLEAAIALLDYQHVVHQATQPGGVLRQNGWFITAMAINDYLLGAMVVYLAIQGQSRLTSDDAPNWMDQGGQTLPDKQGLYKLLQRAHKIWTSVVDAAPAVKKACITMGIMLNKLKAAEGPVSVSHSPDGSATPPERPEAHSWMKGNLGYEDMNVAPFTFSGFASAAEEAESSRPSVDPTSSGQVPFPMATPADLPWTNLTPNMDMINWKTQSSFEDGLGNSGLPGEPVATLENFLMQQDDASSMSQLDSAMSGFWAGAELEHEDHVQRS